MSHKLNYDPLYIFIALLPLLIQIIGITAILILSHEDSLYSLFAIIISVIWLKLSDSDVNQKMRKFYAERELFIKIGEWLKQNNAAEIHDKVQEKYGFDSAIEHNEITASETADAILFNVRLWILFLLYIYLVYVVITLII